jgi:hypothetical protein
MKKLLILCLLLAATFSTKAQEKVSMEVTAKFIETNLKKFIGNKADGWLVTNVSFNGKELVVITSYLGTTNIDTYSNFDWEDVNFSVRDDSEKSIVPGFENVTLSFKTSYKQYISSLKKERLFDWFDIHMPSDKIESLKKAFLRLQEIANEENKDPFAN